MDAAPGLTLRTLAALRFFLAGLISLTIQTILVREGLFAFHGGEIGLGFFYASWLAAIACGARCGAAWVRRAVRTEARASQLFQIGLALLPWIGLAQLALFRYHRSIFSVGAGGYLPALAYVALLLVAAAPAGAMTGWLFPVGLRAGGFSAGSAYALEALGSMAGGAWAALYALPRMPAAVLLSAVGATGLLCWGAETRVQSGSMRGRVWGALLLLPLAIALLSGLAGRVDRAWMAARWERLGTGTRPVLDLSTPYHQITVGELQGEASLYIDGLYQGGLDDPYEDSLAATIVATQHPAPHRMLLLAPGCYGPVRLLAGVPSAQVDVVRADAAIDRATDVRKPRGKGDALAATCACLTADPRSALRRMARDPATARVDLIAVLHGGPAGGATNRLYTDDFFRDCGQLLARGGVLVVTIPGAVNVASPEEALLRAAVFAALTEVFREVRVTPGSVHYFFAAGPRSQTPASSPLTWNPDSLAARRARLWPTSTAWPAALFAALFPPERIAALEKDIVTAVAGGVRPNRDRQPQVYYEQLRRWDRFSGSHLAGLLRAGHDHPWRWSIVLVAVLACAAWLLRRSYGQGVVSLASTGMVGMGADLCLLLLYQTFRGTLYLMVGLVVALYMGGLGAGAVIGARRLTRGIGRTTLAGFDLIWLAFLIAWIPLIAALPRLSGALTESLLLGLAFLAGVLTALPFPWVAALLDRDRGRDPAERASAAGIADAADHAGALWGALATGTFLVPLLGFDGALLVLAGVKALSALGWLLP